MFTCIQKSDHLRLFLPPPTFWNVFELIFSKLALNWPCCHGNKNSSIWTQNGYLLHLHSRWPQFLQPIKEVLRVRQICVRPTNVAMEPEIIREVIRHKVEKLPKIRSEFLSFWGHILTVRGPKFLTQFLKLYSLPNVWESFMAIGRGTLEITRWKRRKNDNTQQNIIRRTQLYRWAEA